MSRAFVLMAAFAACLAVASADICATGPKFTDSGATFDLTALMRSGDTPDYTVTDGDIPCTPNVEQNFTYVFDVCADVTGNNKPAVCAGKTAPALQYDPSQANPTCYVLGRTGVFSLINKADPSAGIQLTYTGGDQCNHGGQPYREVTLTFGCSNTKIPTPTVANEPTHCHYYVEMNSIYGCPVECPLGGENRDLCGGHGICGYDQTNSVAKCFCDTGYAGSDCSTQADATDNSSGNGAIIGLLVTVLLVAVVMGIVLFFVVRMLRAYRQDAHNYMAMHNQDLGTQDI